MSDAANQQVSTQPAGETIVSSGKTVKHTKKVTSSSRSSAVKKTTTTTTSGSGGNSSTSASSVVEEQKKSAAATTTTSTTSSTTAAGKVNATTTSSTTGSMSCSRSITIQQSGQAFTQYLSGISSEGVTDQATDIDSIRAALASYSPHLQLQELVMITPEEGDSTAIRLNSDDVKSMKDGSKAAVLSFNVSEFESQSLEVKTDGNKVEVHAKKKQINADGEERSEEFSRTYELPTQEAIDPTKVTTSVFKEGVLTIELPIGSELTLMIGNGEN